MIVMAIQILTSIKIYVIRHNILMEVYGQPDAPSALPARTEWLGHRAGLHAMQDGKISFLCRESNPGRPDRGLVDIPTELSRLPY
jgi:hypothetical protein